MDQPHLSLDSMHRGEASTTTSTNGHKQQQQQLQQKHACSSTTNNTARMSPPLLSTDANVAEILSCSLCTYSDVCLIPQAGIIVRTYRTRTGGPLMQVLDWALQHSIDLGPHRRDDSEMSDPDADDGSDGETETEPVMEEEEEGHQDLISGMDVNDEGTLLVSCSIDGTIRVWDVLVAEFGDAYQRDSKGKGKKGNAAKEGQEFLEKMDKFGCPVRARRLLTGHVGWVNVVSGGSDHTVRIWDALSGTLLHLISDLFTTRDLDLGVFSVAIRKPPCSTPTTNESGIIAVGTVIEGYQLFSLSTGDLIMELDEPLTSRQHTEFETETYQQYAAKVAITETVIVTNSKLRGMFRIASKPRRVQGDEEDEDEEEEEVETIHTFKVNKSGSMLMCTLCDGRVALFEFGRSRKSATEKEVVVSMLDCFDSRLRSASGFGGVTVVGEDGDDVQQHIGHDQEQEHPPASSATGVATVESIVQDEQEGGEGEDACSGGGALAWIWSRDRRGDQRVVLV
ncbi:hypothetical protein KI688_002695 [Linnemannia hyalina]|uniref:WD40 repeat-like protein n=1 Tax=Linnemannia hyalina TaxID=64524 RepID=A0A9P7XQ70_9FUNG|nr:hypothetical protein KI688_002695 [Linnemannia hyalina]